jgi:hypothetical protein
MAMRKSVFTYGVEEFLTALSDFRHYQTFVNWQLREAMNRLASSLKVFKSRGYKGKYGMGTALSVLDVLHRGTLEVRAPAGRRVTSGANLSLMATEMEGRFNALLLVYLFERMEAYLKSLYGTLLFQLRDEITLAEKQQFRRVFPKLRKQEGTPQYYLEYANFLCKRDCNRAVVEFEKQVAWKAAFSVPWYDMPFDELLGTLAFCRHCIVHKEGRVAKDRMRKLSRPSGVFVRSCLHQSLHGKEELLLPDTKTIDTCFEAVASYAYGLYVLLSERCSMAVDRRLFKRPRNAKRQGRTKGAK